MDPKQLIKKAVPDGVWSKLSRLKQGSRLASLYDRDRERFVEYCSGTWNQMDEEQLRGRLMFNIHRLEKGLSHTDFRAGFGEEAVRELHRLMGLWRECGLSTDDPIYVGANNVLACYVDRHTHCGAQLPEFFSQLFPQLVKNPTTPSDVTGVKTVRAADKKDNRSLDYAALFKGRTTVREYAKEPVDLDLVREAIELAMKTPSVCNRQSFRVTLVTNPEKIDRLLTMQGGWRGYAMPPLLALVTTDIRAFVSIEERNEPYIDGGLFLMSFLNSLEYVGLAACTLNAMFRHDQDALVRDVAQVPDCEDLIAFVAIGNFPETVASPASMRYDASNITRIVD